MSRLSFEIVNPKPNQVLNKGSEIVIKIINPSLSLVFNTPSDIKIININTEFNMYIVTSDMTPFPIKVKSKEEFTLPDVINPLTFLTFTAVVQQPIDLKDFAKYTIIMRMFDEY